MLVLKFGGTSVGTATNIKKVAEIVKSYNEPVTVVLSAVSGTTNTLVEIHNLLNQHKKDEATLIIDNLEIKYHQLLDELYTSEYYQLKALTFVRSLGAATPFSILQSAVKPLNYSSVAPTGLKFAINAELRAGFTWTTSGQRSTPTANH